MIYITGDCHQDFERFKMKNFPEQRELTKDDHVIICGDFGGVWNKNEESKKEKALLDWLDDKNFTTLFVDGNHENFDRLYEYPEEKWHGGRVHKIRPSVIHLMRGQIFELERKKFFTFGGASSHDIDGGFWNLTILILRKRRNNWIEAGTRIESTMSAGGNRSSPLKRRWKKVEET